tara:strand:- start:513 stop:923 length:411 start_codon:yes stop_codon:yes gene_type:complete
MEHWWVYLLVFFFGYLTHKTFYFLGAQRLGLIVIRSSHVIYLSAMTKALEQLTYAHETTLYHLATTDKNSATITTTQLRFEKEIKKLKERSVDVLLELHPSFFRRTADFTEWKSAMEYLEIYRDPALAFWRDADDS